MDTLIRSFSQRTCRPRGNRNHDPDCVPASSYLPSCTGRNLKQGVFTFRWCSCQLGWLLSCMTSLCKCWRYLALFGKHKERDQIFLFLKQEKPNMFPNMKPECRVFGYLQVKIDVWVKTGRNLKTSARLSFFWSFQPCCSVFSRGGGLLGCHGELRSCYDFIHF